MRADRLFSICQTPGESGCTLGSETAISANMPAIGVSPFILTETETTSAAKLHVEYFNLTMTVSR